MIISQSVEFDVILKENLDYKGEKVFTVIYGLQVEQFKDLLVALDEYTSCISHAAACEGYFGE
jgi:hypothetical protein